MTNRPAAAVGKSVVAHQGEFALLAVLSDYLSPIRQEKSVTHPPGSYLNDA